MERIYEQNQRQKAIRTHIQPTVRLCVVDGLQSKSALCSAVSSVGRVSDCIESVNRYSGIKLETNMAFERMINSLKNKNNSSDTNEFIPNLVNKLKAKENKTDIVEDFENDMNKLVNKK